MKDALGNVLPDNLGDRKEQTAPVPYWWKPEVGHSLVGTLTDLNFDAVDPDGEVQVEVTVKVIESWSFIGKLKDVDPETVIGPAHVKFALKYEVERAVKEAMLVHGELVGRVVQFVRDEDEPSKAAGRSPRKRFKFFMFGS